MAELKALREEAGDETWRVVSDVAQVVACYLRCHPCVEAVRYPGLKEDAQFDEASTTLVGGFGPVVRFKTAGEWHELTCANVDVRAFVMELEGALVAMGRAL